MDKNQNPLQNQIQVDLPEAIAEGIYSNLAIITHSNAEFVVDFLSMLPGVSKAKVKSRIILTPAHAKRLLRALKENVAKFEAANGPIVDSEPTVMPPLNMGPTGIA